MKIDIHILELFGRLFTTIYTIKHKKVVKTLQGSVDTETMLGVLTKYFYCKFPVAEVCQKS